MPSVSEGRVSLLLPPSPSSLGRCLPCPPSFDSGSLPFRLGGSLPAGLSGLTSPLRAFFSRHGPEPGFASKSAQRDSSGVLFCHRGYSVLTAQVIPLFFSDFTLDNVLSACDIMGGSKNPSEGAKCRSVL